VTPLVTAPGDTNISDATALFVDSGAKIIHIGQDLTLLLSDVRICQDANVPWHYSLLPWYISLHRYRPRPRVWDNAVRRWHAAADLSDEPVHDIVMPDRPRLLNPSTTLPSRCFRRCREVLVSRVNVVYFAWFSVAVPATVQNCSVVISFIYRFYIATVVVYYWPHRNQCESKSSPYFFAIFPLRLGAFPWNFAN